ncbi:esterase FE4-like [Onthophagus taurus]|uniref:esterase FE4-like n=1 Tax=Onthophagus taurus TaxID=166361 RepID=UPI0039BE797E
MISKYILSIVLLLPAFVTCNRSPLIEIEQGKIRGVVKKDWKGGRFYSFLKVPYAKPPIGERRFKDPQPAEKWDGILEAEIDMPQCVQLDSNKKIVGQEDCLYMNIHTPNVATKNLRPVMVFIHGGGYTVGSGQLDMFGPEFFLPEKIVLITINYRLGFFGFLNFENPEIGVPGNAALKDQNLALKWIQKNIEMFGGDPGSVTLFGESAGGASVHMHMLSPLSKGLVHRVIAQSGSANCIWNEAQKNTGIYLAENLNFSVDDEKEILKYLQSIPIDDIIKVEKKSDRLLPLHKIPLFGPVVEPLHSGDIFLSESPAKILSRGQFQKLPFILGFNSNEVLVVYAQDMLIYGELKEMPEHYFIPHQLNVTDEESKQNLFNRIKKQYKINEYKAGTEKYSKLFSEIFIIYGVYASISEHVLVDHKDLYLYKFSSDTKLNYFKQMHEDIAKMPGAGHVEELGYLFKNKFTPKDLTQNSIEGQNIIKMVKLWTNFAKHGKPTPKNNDLGVSWLKVTRNKLNYLDISTDSLITKVEPFDRKNMEFWDKLLGKSVKYEHTEL